MGPGRPAVCVVFANHLLERRPVELPELPVADPVRQPDQEVLLLIAVRRRPARERAEAGA